MCLHIYIYIYMYPRSDPQVPGEGLARKRPGRDASRVRLCWLPVAVGVGFSERVLPLLPRVLDVRGRRVRSAHLQSTTDWTESGAGSPDVQQEPEDWVRSSASVITEPKPDACFQQQSPFLSSPDTLSLELPRGLQVHATLSA